MERKLPPRQAKTHRRNPHQAVQIILKYLKSLHSLIVLSFLVILVVIAQKL